MNLIDLLNYIQPSSLDYQEWVNVGMALKHEGLSCDIWDDWSRADSRYKAGDCEKKWRTFKEGSTGIVTGGTIYEYAVRGGYIPPEDKIFDWDDEIEFDSDVIIKDVAWLDNSIIEEPRGEWDQLDELRRYLQILFNKDDIIGFCVDAEHNEEKNKWTPASKGAYGLTQGKLLERIKKAKSIEDVIGDYERLAGAWIRFNPLDGKGVNNQNVTDYRYALVESDTLEIEKQKALMEELKLPIAVMIHSGGKSIHAIVKINAINLKQYQEDVDYLYTVCEKNGLVIDKQNKNPSRLSRIPGVFRGNKKQFIIAENIGFNTFQEWKDYIEDSIDTLPDIIDFSEVMDNLPPLAPELIEGILRQGHKMIIAGASKAGKSFMLIELAIAIASGGKWLGHQCRKGKVLYINLEVDKLSFMDRVKTIIDIIKPGSLNGMLNIWNLRGENVTIDILVPRLLRRAQNKGYSAIIIDPLYKINQGDENNASEMAKFFNKLDSICKNLNTSVICCHHHSKGSQGGKFSMDRASGSGVFARDPDALLDMIQLNPSDAGMSLPSPQTAWRVSATLREFPSPDDIDLIFDYPVHYITEDLKDADALCGADSGTKRQRGHNTQSSTKQGRIDRLLQFIENWDEIKQDDSPYPTIADAGEYFKSDKGFSERNIRNWAKDEDAEFKIRNGNLVMK